MVATRRSLGGQPDEEAANLSKKAQGAIKKLHIEGTDALKGDKKAAEAAKKDVQTYHYRGAVFEVDKDTDPKWIEEQPPRYGGDGSRKRSRSATAEDSTAVNGNTARDEEAPKPKRRRRNTGYSLPIKRKKTARRSLPAKEKSSSPAAQVTTSPPAKRKGATIDDEDQLMPPPKRRASTTNSNIMNDVDAAAAEVDRLSKSISQQWRPVQRSNGNTKPVKPHAKNVEPAPRPRISLSDNKSMEKELDRRKREALQVRESMGNNNKLNVQPLRDEDMLTEEQSIQQKVVEFVEMQQKLNRIKQEFKQAKELNETVKRKLQQEKAKHAEEDDENVPVEDDAAIPNGSSATEQRDEDIIGEQWEREQEQAQRTSQSIQSSDQEQDQEEEQNAEQKQEQPSSSPRAIEPTQDDLEILESPPTAEEPSAAEKPTPPSEYEFVRPTIETLKEQATAGAPRPQTPTTHFTNTKGPSGSSKIPCPTSRGYTPGGGPTGSTVNNSPSTGGSSSSATESKMNFKDLKPDDALPTIGAGGHKLRWSIDRKNTDQGNRAEYAIDVARLDGESKSARARRVKREREIVESWTRMSGGKIIEKGK